MYITICEELLVPCAGLGTIEMYSSPVPSSYCPMTDSFVGLLGVIEG